MDLKAFIAKDLVFSSVLMSCRSHVVQSLADLVHWADAILLENDKAALELKLKSASTLIGKVQQ